MISKRSPEVKGSEIRKIGNYIRIVTQGCTIEITPGLKDEIDRDMVQIEIKADKPHTPDPFQYSISDGKGNGWEQEMTIKVVNHAKKPKLGKIKRLS